MKIIGLLLLLVTTIGLQQEITLSGIAWFFVGLALISSEILSFWIKTEIRASYKNCLPPYRSFRN